MAYPLTVTVVATVTVTVLGLRTGADVIEDGATVDVDGSLTSLVKSPEGIGSLGSCDTEDTAAVTFAGREVSMVAVGIGADEAKDPDSVVGVGELTSLVCRPEGTGILGSCDAKDTAAVG